MNMFKGGLVGKLADKPEKTESAEPTEADEAGTGQFGDGVTAPLYEYRASRLRGGRVFTPNVVRVWSDRIEEYQRHVVLKKDTEAINYRQVAQVKLARGLVWSDITVESTGGHEITLDGVPKAEAEHVKTLIDSAVEAVRIGTMQAAPVAPSSAADELAKLGALVTAGLLTPEEYAAAKAKVLA